MADISSKWTIDTIDPRKCLHKLLCGYFLPDIVSLSRCLIYNFIIPSDIEFKYLISVFSAHFVVFLLKFIKNYIYFLNLDPNCEGLYVFSWGKFVQGFPGTKTWKLFKYESEKQKFNGSYRFAKKLYNLNPYKLP